jgi:ParB family chromosome partitioning protein
MSGKKRGGLGRGLGALIPPTTHEEEEEAVAQPSQVETVTDVAADTPTDSGLLMVPIDAISPNPHQPRQAMNADKLEELALSIREHGLLQPLLVTRASKDKYSLIAGERRWRASRLAGLDSVPVVIKEATSGEILQMALVENIQRADLNPLEAALAYKSLVDDFGLTQEVVAERVGKSRSAVANSLRLLRLPPQVIESLSLELIEEGHARALLQVPDEQLMLRLLERIVADGLNVRQVEALARRLAESPAPGEDKATVTQAEGGLYSEEKALEERFRNALGTKVQLSKSSRGGKLVIYFYSDEDLDRIYGAIVGEE